MATKEFVKKYRMDLNNITELKCNHCGRRLNPKVDAHDANYITFWGNVIAGSGNGAGGLIGDNLTEDRKVFRINAFCYVCVKNWLGSYLFRPPGQIGRINRWKREESKEKGLKKNL
uniref:Uncharacterized protein n=2 Tax=viral metagenome TaxID=1070528 RepID=A0A6M3KLF2_9ZZZZ